MQKIFEITAGSLEATAAFAKQLSAHLKPGNILALVGELGAGKTTFVKSLAHAWGVPSKTPVTSPTFTLIQEYPAAKGPFFHIDFYRLSKENELSQLGLEEYFEGKGIVVVEWADRFPTLFPEKTLWLEFIVKGEKERHIHARGTEIWRHLGREFGTT